MDHGDGLITCDNAGELDVTVLGHSPGLECGLEQRLGLLCELSNDGAEGAPGKAKSRSEQASPQNTSARHVQGSVNLSTSIRHPVVMASAPGQVFLQGSLGLLAGGAGMAPRGRMEC